MSTNEPDLGADDWDFGTPRPVGDGLDKLVPKPWLPVQVLLEDGTETVAHWYGKPTGWHRYDVKKRGPSLKLEDVRLKVVKWRHHAGQDWKLAVPPEGPYLQPEDALFESLPEGVIP